MCAKPWRGSTKYFLDGPLAFYCLFDVKNASENFIPPSKIVNRRGGMIPRCWDSGCGHGGGRYEPLALVNMGLEPTDSSVQLVLT